MLNQDNPIATHYEINAGRRSYESNADELADERAWVDLLIRAAARRRIATVEDVEGSGHDHGALLAHFIENKQPGLPAPSANAQNRIADLLDRARSQREQVRAAMERSDASVDLRLRRLRDAFSLNEIEVDVIAILLTVAADAGYGRLLAIMQDREEQASLTAGLLLSMIRLLRPDAADIQLRSPVYDDGPLWSNDLVRADDGECRSFVYVHLDDTVLQFLLGRERTDPRVRAAVEGRVAPLSPGSLILDAAVLDRVSSLRAHLANGGNRERAVVFLHGVYGSGRLDVARTLDRRSNGLLILDVPKARTLDTPWETVLRMCYRDARMGGWGLYWKNADSFGEEPGDGIQKSALLRAAQDAPVFTVLSGETPPDPRGQFRDRPFVRIGLPVPAFDTRIKLWERHLPSELNGDDAGGDRAAASAIATTLAAAFQLTEGQIRDAVADARAFSIIRGEEEGGDSRSRESESLRLAEQAKEPHDTTIGLTQIEAACRRQAGRRLHTLAKHLAPRVGAELRDIVLPGGPTLQLEELLHRVRHRSDVNRSLGLRNGGAAGGVLALFTGTPGTGKTFAAEVLASMARVDLYKIDMSMVVSKWVGGTEKNLSRVFSEATDSNAILFFDEAEALFGKRAEVRDARDRWANQEVNYLLQRIEDYAGVVIMATNLRQNIDPAFHRRIHVLIEFPFPQPQERMKIWQRILGEQDVPPTHTLTEADFIQLARLFALSGGSIRNVVVAAAFRAHAHDRSISYGDVQVAVARELQKLGKPIPSGAFGSDYENVRSVLFPRTDEYAGNDRNGERKETISAG